MKGLIERNGWYYLVKRVPRRFERLDPRRPVRVSLKTRDPERAVEKVHAVLSELWAYWEALEAGSDPDARVHYEKARRLAAARGFVYRPAEELLAGPLDDLLTRLEHLAERRELHDLTAIRAMLGTVDQPKETLSGAFEVYLVETEDRRAGKSRDQVRRWEAPRRKALRNLIEAIGDKPFAELTREDALAFRDWWRARIAAGGVSAQSANKDFTHVSHFVNLLDDLRRQGLKRPFAGLAFRATAGQRLALPLEAIRRLAAPGSLEGLNAEAADALLGLVETGLRPAELLGARPEDIVLDAPVPHIRVRPYDRPEPRQLKNAPSRRDVPLLGVSLLALQRRRDGFPRYRDRSASWSALVNKYLRQHALVPEGCTAYGLRHAFEDRLTAAECPERVKADLMGHALARERYGQGPTLEQKAKWLERIALPLLDSVQ